MSDEIASATLTTSQKAVETALELIKILAPMMEKLLSEIYHKSVEGINYAGSKVSSIKATGTISSKGLMVEAQKANSPISVTSNILARDAELFAQKAKEYKIPIVIVGNNEKQTIEFLERDKAVVEQISNEIVQERLKNAPQSVKCFSLGENNVSAIKAEFEKNGIECQFLGGKDGKVSCVYPAENAEQVEIIKEEYKKIYEEVRNSFQIEQRAPETEHQAELKQQIDELVEERNISLSEAVSNEENEELQAYYSQEISKLQKEFDDETRQNFEQSDTKIVTITDTETDKTLSFNLTDNITKDKLTEKLRDEFGYSASKAEIAANKFCYDLTLDKEKFFAKPTQYDNLNALKTNIRYESDDITIRDMRFDAVNFKDGNDTHIIIKNGDNAIALTPAKMTADEMKKLCIDELKMSEYQAERATVKAVKIESQVRSQLEERAVAKDGISKEMHIERKTDQSFTVSMGDMSKSYNFGTINVENKIARDFDIPLENAKNAVNKAHNQSVLQNKINNTLKKRKKPVIPETDKPKIKVGKGLKKH